MSFTAQFITTLLFALVAILNNQVCGFRLDNRIVGGSSADIKQFPYHLALLKNDKYRCGASIINPQWAITAAQCVQGSSPSVLTLRSGSSYYGKSGTIHRVSKVVAHDKFNSNSKDYDVAVLKETQVSDALPAVAKLSLPASGSSPGDGTKGVVTGWGATSPGSATPSSALQQVTLPTIGKAVCGKSLGSAVITEQMICAGYATGGKDSCEGDAGGPFVVNKNLVGIVSWGKGCAAPGSPRVLVKVSAVRAWIKKQTGV